MNYHIMFTLWDNAANDNVANDNVANHKATINDKATTNVMLLILILIYLEYHRCP